MSADQALNDALCDLVKAVNDNITTLYGAPPHNGHQIVAALGGSYSLVYDAAESVRQEIIRHLDGRIPVSSSTPADPLSAAYFAAGELSTSCDTQGRQVVRVRVKRSSVDYGGILQAAIDSIKVEVDDEENSKTRYDKILDWCKNKRVIVVVLVIVIIIGGVGGLLSDLETISNWLGYVRAFFSPP